MNLQRITLGEKFIQKGHIFYDPIYVTLLK